MFGIPQNPVLFVGTYTEHKDSRSKGIHICRMDASSGELASVGEAATRNPSFLDLHPQRNFLYAVNEVGSFDGEAGGGVSAFAADPASGKLTLLNSQISHGEDPCYICIEPTGRFALVANYSSGSVSMSPIQPGGQLGPATAVVQHSGSSVDSDRQAGPHAHCIRPDPENRFAISADLGADKLLVYRMDFDHGKLIKHSEVGVQAGAGPRHFIFHPNGQYIYLLNELNSTLIVYRYRSGNFEELQTITTLPADFKGKNLAAALHICGKYLYASNRGHDSIAWYRIDEGTGRLAYQGHVASGGREPRDFVIDPGGTFLLAAHQQTNNIVVFKIDPATGGLGRTGHAATVSQPVCLRFMPSQRRSASRYD